MDGAVIPEVYRWMQLFLGGPLMDVVYFLEDSRWMLFCRGLWMDAFIS